MSPETSLALARYPLTLHACRCGCDELMLSRRLAVAFYDLAHLIDDATIQITSGYRCTRHNKLSNGSPKSRHLYGQALDLRIHGLTIADQYAIALEVQAFACGGIGVYLDWEQGPGLHLDVRGYVHRWASIDSELIAGNEGVQRALIVAEERGV